MSGRTRTGARGTVLAALLLAMACVPSEPPAPGGDDGAVADPGTEAGGDVAVDPGRDAGPDAPPADVPKPDAAVDPGPADAPGDAATDARPDAAVDVTVDVAVDAAADVPADAAADPGPAGVRCWPAPVVFPDFDRACQADGDCGVAVHQSDCCGSLEVRGIRTDRLAEFQVAEDACRAQWPPCGCAGRIPTADDGTTSGDLADFHARCESGQCRSHAAAGCGDLERRVDEALAGADACAASDACVMRELGAVCGSLSCRQVAVARDASKEALAALDALGAEGLSLGCPDYRCGCGFLGVPSCVGGHCRLPSPGDTCDAVKAAFDAVLADPATTACQADGDCWGTTLTFAPFCTAECACAVVTNQAAAGGIQAIGARWQQLGCPVEPCACTKCATVLRCVEGRCKGRL